MTVMEHVQHCADMQRDVWCVALIKGAKIGPFYEGDEVEKLRTGHLFDAFAQVATVALKNKTLILVLK